MRINNQAIVSIIFSRVILGKAVRAVTREQFTTSIVGDI